MLKQIIVFILLCLIAIFIMTHIKTGLHALVAAYNWVDHTLAALFSGGTIGHVIRKLIALAGIPILVGLIPAFIYWLIKRSGFPYFMEVVWVTWLLLVAALAS